MVKTADVQLGLEGGDKGLVLHSTFYLQNILQCWNIFFLHRHILKSTYIGCDSFAFGLKWSVHCNDLAQNSMFSCSVECMNLGWKFTTVQCWKHFYFCTDVVVWSCVSWLMSLILWCNLEDNMVSASPQYTKRTFYKIYEWKIKTFFNHLTYCSICFLPQIIFNNLGQPKINLLFLIWFNNFTTGQHFSEGFDHIIKIRFSQN